MTGAVAEPFSGALLYAKPFLAPKSKYLMRYHDFHFRL